jgi:hypothetical protein
MNTERLPWEIVETFPSTDAGLIAHWDRAVADAGDQHTLARSMIGRALSLYWATQEGVVDEPWALVAQQRSADLDRAVELARRLDDVDLLAEALLGVLYGTWGPDRHLQREPIIDELSHLQAHIADEELRLRTMEWQVLQHFDTADLGAARRAIDTFARAAAGTELIVFTRREVLWRGCLAMLEGDLDRSLQINRDAISSTANVAGSPFSFQNVAITLAIERYLRRGLDDTVEAIRSIRASSPRVGANWDAGLAFALSEIGELDEASGLFEVLAADRFTLVPRDLNWLVTMQLLGLVALTIDADRHGSVLIELLGPFAHLDGTHGSGYASYGPVGRVLGSLLARWGDPDESERVFDDVLATRSPGPWRALTQHDRAVARRSRRPADALADATLAESELRRFGLDGWAASARAMTDDLVANGHGGAVAILRDGRWTLRHDAGVAVVSPSVGIDHLTTLLHRAGDIVDVSDLDRSDGASIERSASAESSLDPTARSQYRRRLAELEDRRDLDDSARFEIEFLRRELGGAAYVVSNSAELERLRVRVTKAIHRAIDQIADASPALATHLRDSVQTGRTCSYQPAGGRPWAVIRR